MFVHKRHLSSPTQPKRARQASGPCCSQRAPYCGFDMLYYLMERGRRPTGDVDSAARKHALRRGTNRRAHRVLYVSKVSDLVSPAEKPCRGARSTVFDKTMYEHVQPLAGAVNGEISQTDRPDRKVGGVGSNQPLHG